MSTFLDATCVVQMIHFFCAYWILSRFFLKPAYALVMQINRESTDLNQAAFKAHEERRAIRQEKSLELAVRQQELIQYSKNELSPAQESVVLSPPAEKILVSEPSKNEIMRDLSAYLKNRLIHEQRD